MVAALAAQPMKQAIRFMMARLPGLVAQVHEEKSRERPMRTIHPTDYEYDGAAERHLGDEG
jgi:citrate synthase